MPRVAAGVLAMVVLPLVACGADTPVEESMCEHAAEANDAARRIAESGSPTDDPDAVDDFVDAMDEAASFAAQSDDATVERFAVAWARSEEDPDPLAGTGAGAEIISWCSDAGYDVEP